MNGYNFTERVRKVLALAREEATAARHEYVGTEHILLALIRDGEGVGYAVLGNLSRNVDAVRQHVLDRLPPPGVAPAAGPDLPYTSLAKKTIELAMAEARDFKHRYVGTEHLLLGLIREKEGLASQVLIESAVDLEAARAETIRLLGTETPSGASGPAWRGPVGRTTIAPPRCSGCDVEMDTGYMALHSKGHAPAMKWVRGLQPGRPWLGGELSSEEFRVTAFRCPTCGVLRMIATQA